MTSTTSTAPPMTTVLSATAIDCWSNAIHSVTNNDLVSNAILEQSVAHQYNLFHDRSSRNRNTIYDDSDNDYIFSSIFPTMTRKNDRLSLHGQAYHCDGLIIAFQGNDKLQCRSTSGGDTFECGTYTYQNTGLIFENKFLSGSLFTTTTTTTTTIETEDDNVDEADDDYDDDFPLSSSFSASNMYYQDDILLSFFMEIDELSGGFNSLCHIVSLDYFNYHEHSYVGLQCPKQDVIPGGLSSSFVNNNHYSLGQSGDISLRSLMSIGRDATHSRNNNDDNQIIRDSYGVYKWYEDDTIRIYFGPQQGRQGAVLDGVLVSKQKAVKYDRRSSRSERTQQQKDKQVHGEGGQDEDEEIIKYEEVIELYIYNGYDDEPIGPCVYDGNSHLRAIDAFNKQKVKSDSNKALLSLSIIKKRNRNFWGLSSSRSKEQQQKEYVVLASSVMVPIATIVFVSFITELLFRIIQ